MIAGGDDFGDEPAPDFFLAVVRPGIEAGGTDSWMGLGGDFAAGRQRSPLWRVKIASNGKLLNGPAGCAGDGIFFFTGGGEGRRDLGETLAIEPNTGRVLWRSEQFASQTGVPSYQDDRVYLPGAFQRPLACLGADAGEVLWTNDISTSRWHVDTIALGPDYFSVNNKYKGGAWRWDLETGKPIRKSGEPVQLWGPGHGCGAIVLTASGHAMSATINGICLTDAQTGELSWKSEGFGSYACPHPIAANGRIFYAPQTSGMLFCFEPDTQ
ncbi:MAG: outer membrane protein assembly factor BamB [Verrucomicrobiales bacterium]